MRRQMMAPADALQGNIRAGARIRPTVLRRWPVYVIEGTALGLFMVSALLFTVVLEHPDLPIRAAIDSPALRRLLMGLAMGGTAAALIYSPFGARSGAHMNPAVTLAFARLGLVPRALVPGYVTAQFAGATAGLAAAGASLGSWATHPSVNLVATRPGPAGPAVAFAAEVAIAFAMMLVVLATSTSRHTRFTGLAASGMLALYILVEAPLSGTSLNPARSFASAALSGALDVLWIYLLAPLAGMLLAAEVFVRRHGLQAALCARLNHSGSQPCIFGCKSLSDSPANH
jgi:aquaporin Z